MYDEPPFFCTWKLNITRHGGIVRHDESLRADGVRLQILATLSFHLTRLTFRIVYVNLLAECI